MRPGWETFEALREVAEFGKPRANLIEQQHDPAAALTGDDRRLFDELDGYEKEFKGYLRPCREAMRNIMAVYEKVIRIKGLPKPALKMAKRNQETYDDQYVRFGVLEDDFDMLKREAGLIESSVSEAVDQKHIKKLARMTDENQHPEALVYLATEVLKDRRLAAMAKAALDLQNAFGSLTPGLKMIRDDLYAMLDSTAKTKLSPEDYKQVMGAL